MLLRLHQSMKHISDSYLHEQIRPVETLPTIEQVEFRAEFDRLLAELSAKVREDR